jgi:hypothetical protein
MVIASAVVHALLVGFGETKAQEETSCFGR